MLLQPCSVSSFPRCSVEVQLRRDLPLVRVRQRMVVVVVTMMLRRRCEWSEWIWMVDNGRRVEQNGTNMMPSMEFSIVLPRSGHPFFHIFPFATATYGVGSTVNVRRWVPLHASADPATRLHIESSDDHHSIFRCQQARGSEDREAELYSSVIFRRPPSQDRLP